MGWTSFDKSYCVFDKRGRVDKKATMTKEIESYGDIKVIKAAMGGGNYYAVEHHLKTDKHYLLVCLTKVDGNDFYYKDMDDIMGPCYYDCPKSILLLADELCPCTKEYDPYGYAREWRDKCWAKLREKSLPTAYKNCKRGQVVKWRVPDDSRLMMGDSSLAGKEIYLTKIEGYRSWMHRGLWLTRVPNKYVNPNDCELVTA